MLRHVCIISYHIMTCHAMSRYGAVHYALTCRVVPCHAMPTCHAISCMVAYHAASYHSTRRSSSASRMPWPLPTFKRFWPCRPPARGRGRQTRGVSDPVVWGCPERRSRTAAGEPALTKSRWRSEKRPNIMGLTTIRPRVSGSQLRPCVILPRLWWSEILR